MYKVWPATAAAAELEYTNVSAIFIHSCRAQCDWWVTTWHSKWRDLSCCFYIGKKAQDDWAADSESWVENLLRIVTVTHTHIKPNLDSRPPHLSRKQMEVYSLKPFSGDTKISRSVSLSCSEGRRTTGWKLLFSFFKDCKKAVGFRDSKIALSSLVIEENWSAVWPLLFPSPHESLTHWLSSQTKGSLHWGKLNVLRGPCADFHPSYMTCTRGGSAYFPSPFRFVCVCIKRHQRILLCCTRTHFTLKLESKFQLLASQPSE